MIDLSIMERHTVYAYSPVSNILNITVGTPGPPINFVGYPENGFNARLVWTPGDNGGSPLTSYDYTYRQTANIIAIPGINASNAPTIGNVVVNNGFGLDVYYIKIRAVNANGPGVWGPEHPVSMYG